MNIQKLLTICFVLLVILKYVFQVNIHEKYLFFIAGVLAISTNFGRKSSAIEMFDGSTVAFDREAFENLNRVVNEIAGEGKITIPGNLEVLGTTTLKKKLTCEDQAHFNKFSRFNENLECNKFCTVKEKLIATKLLEVGGTSTLRGALNVDGISTLKNTLNVKKESNFDKRIDSTKEGIRTNKIFGPLGDSRSRHLGLPKITVESPVDFTSDCKIKNLDVLKTGDEIQIAVKQKSGGEEYLKLLYDTDAINDDPTYTDAHWANADHATDDDNSATLKIKKGTTKKDSYANFK
jgi:hypothetical protein